MDRDQVIKNLNGIPLWRLAAEIGVSEGTVIRWLRFPLEGEREARVKAALKHLGCRDD